jgi:hypothetical protein
MIGVAQTQLDKTVARGLAQPRVANIAGEAALPRQSGELVFHDPWEGIVFAMAVALCERGLYPWEAFRERLVAEIMAAAQQDIEL